MPLPLLAAKFYVPPVRAGLVARPRLVDRLLAALERPSCFSLLSGPAGAGKTTLLSAFVARQPRLLAWLSLDEEDNDPARFWTYLASACQSALPGSGESVLAALQARQPLPDQSLPTLLINDMSQIDGSLLLVLDDLHTIQNPAIHTGLTFLLDYLPPNLHLIVSTRVDPPWPLSRYRARHRLVEIRAQELRFNLQEAAEFLNHSMALNLTDGDVAALEARTEGWVAGLQLAALSLQGRNDPAAFVQAFAGSHVYVAEYLLEEVLKRQPPPVQDFLLRTAVLDRLQGELCAAVSGQAKAQTILRDLQRTNLFIIPLDAEDRWFRYHHLFADLLQARLRQSLPAEDIAALHSRAAGWFEQHGLPDEAVQHALEAGDYEHAAQLVQAAAPGALGNGLFSSLKRWLSALPRQTIQHHPHLGIYEILIDLSQGTLDMAEETLNQKEALIRSLPRTPANDRLRRQALAFLGLFLAHQNTSRAIQMAHDMLNELPEDEHYLRVFLYSTLYRAHGMDGDYETAAAAYRECLRQSQLAEHYVLAANTTMVRAYDLIQYGRLDESVHYCQAMLDLEQSQQHEQQPFYPAGPAHIGLAGVALERNQLEAAEEHLRLGIDLCLRGGLDGLYTGYAQRARWLQARGEFAAARAELQNLEAGFQRRDFTLLARQISLRLQMGDVSAAAQALPALEGMLHDPAYATHLPRIAVEALQLLLARVLIAQGETERALQSLDQVQATVEPDGRAGRLMEVHLLRALGLQQSNRQTPPEALDSFTHALALAQPQDMRLLLLEEGQALIPLLQAIVCQEHTPDNLQAYARQLLVDLGESVPVGATGAAPGLVEALTAREMEVLQCIAAGASNADVAEQLVITVRTVKKHCTNIFGKLNVSSRTQAVARARELGLLPLDI